MATATIERGTTTIEITLLEEGGSPLVSRDIGKPGQRMHETGGLDPRSNDQFAGTIQYNLVGRLVGPDAYQNAIELANLIKSHSNGSETILNIDMPEYDSDIEVVPAAGQEQAAAIAYNPGRRNWVDVDIGLTRVSQTQSGSVGSDQIEETPTATGNGPIELRYAGQSVSLTSDIVVERGVGRHNSDIEGQVPFDYPLWIDKQKSAYDAFELQLEFIENPVSKVDTLVDMFGQQLGRDAITLDFNGVYSLGEFNVVPSGSNALRHVKQAGENGVSHIPTINLRRIYAD